MSHLAKIYIIKKIIKWKYFQGTTLKAAIVDFGGDGNYKLMKHGKISNMYSKRITVHSCSNY